MTTMTLRRAAQIFNLIKAETQFEQESDEDQYGYRRRRRGPQKQSFSTSATVTVDGNPRERVDRLRTELLAKKTKIFRLLTIGTEIRQAVAAKQATTGVTALVTERVAVVQQRQILEALLKPIETEVFDPTFVETQARELRTRLAVAGQGQTNANITTPLLTTDDREALRKELAVVRRRQIEIDDKLAELNSSSTVNILSSEENEFLREIGIA